MIPIAQHRDRVLAAAAALGRHTGTRALPDAQGLVLAEDVHTRWPVPLFDNSAMDGYAVRRADAAEGATLRVVADVPAGSAEDPPMGPGEAVRIMTGAPVPTAADAIVPLEHTDLGTAVRDVAPAAIRILTAPKPAAHLRRRGEDAPAGALAVPAGTVLGAWQLSSIASAGHEEVLVHRPARVAVVSTGSELIRPSAVPRRGQIPESNAVLLGAAARAAGAEVTAQRTVSDDPEAFAAALAGLDADVIICSGGASVGAFDVAKAVLSGGGDVRYDAVAMQPGKPQGFGTLDGRLVFSLPGNPVSAAVSFEVFVRPALRLLAGHSDLDRPRRELAAAVPWRCPPGRTQIIPVTTDARTVRPAAAGGSGSHLVTSLAAATALAVVPAETEEVRAGDLVTVMELS